MKLTLKQERFAQHYAIHRCATDAYREAYDVSNSSSKTVWEQASKLLNTNKVSARVKELQGDLAAKTMITLEGIIQELIEIKKLAVEDKQFSPAINALDKVAKLQGYMIDRVSLSGDASNPIRHVTSINLVAGNKGDAG